MSSRGIRTLDLVSNRHWFFLLSGIAVITSIVLLAIPPALRPGIEFTSGTTTLIRFSESVTQSDLRAAYSDLGHPEARVQSTGPNEYLIRTSQLQVPNAAVVEVSPIAAGEQGEDRGQIGSLRLGPDGGSGEVPLYRLHVLEDGACFGLGEEINRVPFATDALVFAEYDQCADAGADAPSIYRVQVDGSGGAIGYVLASETHDFFTASGEPVETGASAADLGERGVVEAELEARFGPFEVLEFASVSSVVSKTAARNASVAVAVASVFIMLYIAIAFASVPRPFRYATCAIVALAHDAIIVLGAFSLFGKLFGIEINLMFVTGLLTIIGFSVHDSIVVFDRVRENVRLAPDAPLAENVNAALVQTLARSLNTSLTLLLTVLALLLLGGVTIQAFLLVLLVGLIAGTYSSIGIAAQLLVSWEEGDFGRLRDRLLRRRHEAGPAASGG